MSDAISTNLHANLSPCIGEYSAMDRERLIEELQDTRDALARAEHAATNNAEQYAAQRKAHREETDRLYAEIGSLKKAATNDAAAREKYTKLTSELDSAIVNVKNFGWVTLTAVLENGLYRDACPRCHEVSCEGCVPGRSDSLRDQTADFANERWLRTWSQLV